MHCFSRLDIHFATRCHFPSCQKVTNPSTCILAVSAAFLSRAVDLFCPFLGFCFLELPSRFTGAFFLPRAFTEVDLPILNLLAFDRCARLPEGARKERKINGWRSSSLQSGVRRNKGNFMVPHHMTKSQPLKKRREVRRKDMALSIKRPIIRIEYCGWK